MSGVNSLRIPLFALGLVALLGLQPSRVSAQDFDAVEIETIELGDGLAMLVGAGGNIGVSVGADGAFLIDDQFAPLSARIRAAVSALGADEIRFVINTHWHGDHTGGNEILGQGGAVIVAHDNVRERMSTEQVQKIRGRTIPASPGAALPVITFSAGATLHLNGHAIRAVHVPHAHTDGDALIHIADANVLHMGDTYFQGAYPYIDLDSGGSLQGVIAAADVALGLANETTKIVPGHGKLSNAAELREYRGMLVAVRNAVAAELAAGKSVEEVVAAKPTAALDAKWATGFIKPDQIVGIAAASLSAR
jgi:cyclase